MGMIRFVSPLRGLSAYDLLTYGHVPSSSSSISVFLNSIRLVLLLADTQRVWVDGVLEVVDDHCECDPAA